LTLDLRNSNSWNQRTKVVHTRIQTKVLFQIDSEVEQVDPNRNQMEEGKGLEVIKAKDMKVGLSKDQSWERDPMDPIDLSWFHKDMEQFQSGLGIDKEQSSSAELANIKGDLGKRREIQIGIDRSGSETNSSSIRRREIN